MKLNVTRKTSRLLTEAVRAGPLAGLTVASRGSIFPPPALVSLINTEDETFDKILALAGESLDELFESRHYLKPIAGFSRRSCGCVAETRSDSTHRALPGRMLATREL